LESSHTDGSGSGDSDSWGADVLGAGLVAGGEVLAAGDDSPSVTPGVVTSPVGAVGAVDSVDSVAEGEEDVPVVSPSAGDPLVDTLAVGTGSVAYAAGAASRATGAITAVAAAAAMARRSFMRTSGSQVHREVRYAWVRPPRGVRLWPVIPVV
jgi:hypothetical protein